MNIEVFNQKVGEFTDRMAQGFARAFNETSKMQELEQEEHAQSVCQSVVNDDFIEITTTLTGGKADLFARTFDSILRGMCGVVKSGRHPLKSAITGEHSDRQIIYSVPVPHAEEFLERLEKANKYIDRKRQDLTKLYEIGISAQHEIGIGRSEVATKYYVSAINTGKSEPELTLSVTTNHPELKQKIADMAMVDTDIHHSLRIRTPKEGIFDVNFRKYRNGISIDALDAKGNQLLNNAVDEVARDINLKSGGHARGKSSSAASSSDSSSSSG